MKTKTKKESVLMIYIAVWIALTCIIWSIPKPNNPVKFKSVGDKVQEEIQKKTDDVTRDFYKILKPNHELTRIIKQSKQI